MANGRVITGYSKPIVSLYSASGTTVTYSGGMPLARGVDVSVSIDVSDDNNFYADNGIEESMNGMFQSGELTMNVDGLKTAAEKLILGLPAAGTDGFTAYGDSQSIPYVGVGFVVRYMEGGTTTYVPVILPKCKFNNGNIEAATQEEEIDWQTQELTASILRDDTANRVWKMVGTGETTEAAAVTKITTILVQATASSSDD